MLPSIIVPLETFRGIRDIDPYGAGRYNAPRVRAGTGQYGHRGLDLRAERGDRVVAPITGIIRRIGRAYADPTCDLGSFHIVGHNVRFKLLYIQPLPDLRVGDEVAQGQLIGHVQDVSAYHSRPPRIMQNHLHVEVYVDNGLVDPESVLPLPKEPVSVA